MSMRITFDLDEADLKFFRAQMTKAKKAAKATPEAEIIDGARSALEQVRAQKVPRFVSERLERIQALIDMLGDEEWGLKGTERKDVVTALSYFADPEDLIPDDVPVIGFLDDAIMIELVVRELANEIEAYADFCQYRKVAPEATREEWLENKRKQLYARMRRRRSGGSARARGTRFRLF